MGGSRCHFRECHVNYQKFPRMHYFHFPLKESERYKKWRLYSNMEKMLEFSVVRRKNICICARHFRIECFMNYKMNRLTPSAVPTIMRLSHHQALDFELDIDNGVLVTLEDTKLKHLIPPMGFECPLSLKDDQILLEKLNELQCQQYPANTDVTVEVDYLDLVKTVEYEEINVEKPIKPLVRSVEFLKTITAPNYKRLREINKEEIPVTASSVSNKKFRILNSTTCAGEKDIISGTSIVLTQQLIQLKTCEVNNDMNFAETGEIENTDELSNNDDQLFLTGEDSTRGDSEGTDDIELIETNDSDVTIVQLKPDKQMDSITDETVKLKSELNKKSQDVDALQIKLSIIEAENIALKETCKKNKNVNKKLLALKIQNEKLKEESASIEILKAEIESRKEETKELKNSLAILKNTKSKDERLEEQFNLKMENERSNSIVKETKLIDEIKVLNNKLELKQQLLNDIAAELKEVQTSVNALKNENDRLTEHRQELEQSINNIQNNFDDKQNDYLALKSSYDNILKDHSTLEQKYWKLQALQNQEATVSTSLENTHSKTLTKAQLFNSIKRYLSASMVSLLRMEMFGSSEREWKNDERQVAVDIFNLGETIYRYFTDEWRFRLPPLRNVRDWLNQSQHIIDDEEDL